MILSNLDIKGKKKVMNFYHTFVIKPTIDIYHTKYTRKDITKRMKILWCLAFVFY